MPPLDDSEIRQILADISFEEGLAEQGPRRVSVIQVETTPVNSVAEEGCNIYSSGFTSTISNYAYSLIQIPVYAVSTLLVVPLTNISTKLVGEERMQSALSILQRLSFIDQKEPELEGCATLLRDIILAQEKTMFYTMTMSTSPPTNSQEAIKKTMPNLKWKCALSLSRSQNVIHRANSNSSSYYTFTYLGDFEVDKSMAVSQDDVQAVTAAVTASGAKDSLNSAKSSACNMKPVITSTKVSATNSRASEATSKVQVANAKVPAANSKVLAANAKVSAANAKVSAANSKVSAANSKVPAANSKVLAANPKVPAANSKVVFNKNRLNRLSESSPVKIYINS